MTDMNIDRLIQGISGAWPSEPAEEAPGAVGHSSTDTLEKSEQDAKKASVELAIPWLMQNYAVSSIEVEKLVSLVSNMQQQIADIKARILDKWSENIEEIKEADKEARRQKIRLGLDQLDHLISHSAQSAAKSPNSAAPLLLGAAASLMVFSAFALEGAAGVLQAGQAAAVNSVHQLNSILYSMGLVPPSLNPNAVLIASLFTLAPIYFSQLSTLGASKGAKGKQIDLQYAKRYAEQIAAMVSNPGFKEAMQSLMGAASLPEAKQGELIALIKLSYLLSALALYQKAELNYISDVDIGQLLKEGGKGLEEGDPRLLLINLFKELRGELPREQLANYLQGALAYFQGNPRMEELMEVPGLLKRMKEEEEYEINKITENPH